MQDTLLVLGLIGALFAVPGCADDISPEGGPDAAPQPPPDPGDPDAGPPLPVSDIATVAKGDGSYLTTVDAISADDWQYFDVETRAEVGAGDAWDLAAQRFHIKVNGGSSGSRGGQVAPITDATMGSVTAIPSEGFITDGDKPAFEQGTGWYQYNPTSHILTPYPIVWVVRTSDGGHIKLVIDGYYDAAGTSGFFTWRWQPLAAGGGS